jgi:centromeric protein E
MRWVGDREREGVGRHLQSALGGNAKTAIICNVTSSALHVDETRGTLQFASRAKAVTNNATVNEILTDEALLKRQKREIEQLRARLAAEAGGGAVDESVVAVRGRPSPFRFALSAPSVATVGTE